MKLTISGLTETGDPVTLITTVQGRAYPDAPLPDDANWLTVRVEAALPGYRADFTGRVRTEDFAEFLRELRHMHEAQTGIAAFCPPEELISLRGLMDDLGQVHWTAVTTFPPGGAVLSFELTSEAGQLPGWIAALEGVCRQFPVVG